MKVLFVNPLGGLGGGERSLLDVLSGVGLVAPGVERVLLTFEGGPLIDRAREMGVESQVLELPPRLSRMGERAAVQDFALAGVHAGGFVRRLRSRIREIAPDVIHTNGIKAHAFSSLAAARPTLLHFRDFLFERRVSRTALRALTGFGRKVAVANSSAVAHDLRRCFPRLPTRTVLNAIDLVEFAPASGDPAWLAERASLGRAPPGTIHFGLAATYAKWKGQDLFLRAAARLCQRRPNDSYRFFVVGGPVYATRGSQFEASELSGLARELGIADSVGFVPFQAKMAPVYRSLDVVVHASTRPEPFGRTVAEAMACARPVLVSAEGGATELFEPGISAIGYEPRSIEALSAAMERLAEDATLRAALSEKAREHAQARFDVRRLGSELMAVYAELAR